MLANKKEGASTETSKLVSPTPEITKSAEGKEMLENFRFSGSLDVNLSVLTKSGPKALFNKLMLGPEKDKFERFTLGRSGVFSWPNAGIAILAMPFEPSGTLTGITVVLEIFRRVKSC